MPDKDNTSKSYKDIGNLPNEYQDETLLDHVVELLGRFHKKSAIAAKLREDFPDISPVIIGILISRAKVKIRETLKIDPTEFKSCILECLQQIISGKAKHKDRLKALEMLADYTGVKQSAMEDPSEYAKRVQEAMRAMDASVDGTVLPSTQEVNSNDAQREAETTQLD